MNELINKILNSSDNTETVLFSIKKWTITHINYLEILISVDDIENNLTDSLYNGPGVVFKQWKNVAGLKKSGKQCRAVKQEIRS